MPRHALSRRPRLRSGSYALAAAAVLAAQLALAPPAAGSSAAGPRSTADRGVAATPLGELVGGPLFEDGKLLASDGVVLDYFGHAVAVSGDTIVVGAWGDDDNGSGSGAVYVFVRPAGGWAAVLEEAAKLLPSDGVAGDVFGGAVAISGDTVVVGAEGADDFGNNSGAAYVFTRPAGGWAGTVAESAKLVPSDPGGEDRFGTSVAIDGATVVVGAPGYDVPCFPSECSTGAAYVFTEPAGGWAGTVMEAATLLASDWSPVLHGGLLGHAVAVSGQTVAASDFFYHQQGNDSGAVWVFLQPAGGWAGAQYEDAKLLASDGALDDNLGFSVAASGTTIVAGAWRHDAGGFDTGAAYVFTEPAGGWTGTLFESAKLQSSAFVPEAYFGRSVAVTEGRVVVGAWSEVFDDGAAYFFDEPPGGWGGMTLDVELAASDGAPSDEFGVPVAAGGGTIVVGAQGASIATGAAYVYDFSLIFADGFESGDLGQWSSTVP